MAKTALIVDDVAFARKVVKEILMSAKYSVVAEASNGDEAVLLYHRHKPDFVIMDVVMPKRGGIEATRKILEDFKSAKVIMVSAMAHEQFLMEAINAGARDYILKPFSPEDLLRSIEKALKEDEEHSSVKRGL
jgi:two-component system chemotaxis response regulator CheY